MSVCVIVECLVHVSIVCFSYFHVCGGGLIPDIMHDLLEGALQYEVKIMLQEMINEENYFTLGMLNSRLTTTELGYMEAKDRPTSIDNKNLTSSGHTLSQAGIFYTCILKKCLMSLNG